MTYKSDMDLAYQAGREDGIAEIRSIINSMRSDPEKINSYDEILLSSVITRIDEFLIEISGEGD